MLLQAIYRRPSAAPVLILATAHLRMLARRAVKPRWGDIYLYCLDSFGPRPREVQGPVENSFFVLLLLNNTRFMNDKPFVNITSVQQFDFLSAVFLLR